MKNKNYILVYSNKKNVFLEEDKSLKDLIFRVLENEESSEEDILENPEEHSQEIIDRVDHCFEIEYNVYGLEYIIFSREEGIVDILDYDDIEDIPDDIKIELYLQYYKD